MNRRLSDDNIRSTCRELLKLANPPTGRQLARTLRQRYGAVGKTARTFQIWREETHRGMAALPPPELAEMHARMLAAEATADEQRARAERAEYREQSHQDHWAMEVDRLRQALQVQTGSALIIRRLQEQVFALTAALNAAEATYPLIPECDAQQARR